MTKIYSFKPGEYFSRNQNLINHHRQTDLSFKKMKAKAENYLTVNEY